MTHRNKSKLCHNEKESKVLGVCAGIADFVGIKVWVIRLGFIASVIFGGWFMIPAYFIAWFFMNKTQIENLSEKSKNFKASKTINHFRNLDYKKKIYKNVDDKKFLGVCSDVADYLDVDVTIVRIVTVLTSFIPGSFVPIAYFIAYFILDKKPENILTHDNSEYSKVKETLSETSNSPRPTFKACSRKFSNLHDRLARMEAYVTSSKFELDNEFKNL